MRKLRVLLGFALGLAAAPRAGAQIDAPRAGGIPDLIGARGLALGAYRGISPGNDGIYTNAAALAARRRYALETQWYLERQGADPSLQVMTGSVVDSEAAVTGGFSYGRAFSGPYIGNLFHLPLAFAASPGFFLGVTGKYFSLGGPAGEQVRSADFDASAYWRATGAFAVGVSGYNLLDAGHQRVLPRGLGAGASFGDDRRFNLAVDWRGDFPRQGKMTSLYAVGGEVLLGDHVPVRGSWLRDETRNASFWSAGLGLVTTSGFALDVSYRQGLDDASNRTIALAVKLFLLSQ